MGQKRRRERDRPKAASDAVYNPNKRVLLSYASQDEHEESLEQTEGDGHPGATLGVTPDKMNVPSCDDDVQRIVEHDVMGLVPDLEEGTEGSERVDERPNDSGLFSRATAKDSTTGQWPALGSRMRQWNEEQNEEEDAEYESTEDEAMAYLRAVKNERRTMPLVFRAPFPSEADELYDSGVGDGRGYWEDDAYIGRAPIGPIMPETAKKVMEPQEAHSKVLKQRFLEMRERMHSSPDEAVLATLYKKSPITFNTSDKKAYASWHRVLMTTTPHPAQVQSLDVDVVGKLLKLIMDLCLVREALLAETTSVWVWSLLARLDDVGTMNNDEVYAIREFGKRAVLVQLSLHDTAAATQLEQVQRDAEAECVPANGSTTDTVANGHGLDLSANQALPDEEDKSSSAAENTHATLDMIITIIGEVFGQRDLLEFRRKWEVADDEVDRSADLEVHDGA
ncbi:hypothetical protein LTR35_016472 [Friedmanniomyces endolithicus]|uniref:Uncharacterized protein n=1 Tax=Friedmanniomyces endolithicus TaxID=329885 RepID=A0AAN6F9W8_9PEZI|nr:hypothetical protein LTR35_016472 [Friedmanniomyces endolithicus]KAK0274001.1 hypothetical protein LTS00_015546 [Friedmanniomyces endolithicus]KAK0306272.1 hypothetical protein LTR82_016398 [Friedmanniomyces endolithicus]KAK0978167.1 hypothetical protein LTR54_015980 [Friedmanniomyces endolithicus]